MQDFRNIKAWEKGHLLTLDIYKITREFPPEECFGLTSQMRRSSASVPTNIAEGCGRGSNAQLRHFMEISMGSASELEYQLLLSRDLEFLTEEQYQQLNEKAVEVKRMLGPFISKLRK